MKKQKLIEFMAKVSDGRLVQYWDNTYELRYKLQDSLLKAFKNDTSKRMG